MNRLEWTTAGLRVLAAWLVAASLTHLPGIVATVLLVMSSPTPAFSGLTYFGFGLGSTAISLLAAVALWHWAPKLAPVVWRRAETHATATSAPITALEFQEALVSLLGLWLIVAGVVDLGEIAPRLKASVVLGTTGTPAGEAPGQAAAIGIKLFAGLTFVLGASAIARLLRLIRTAGVRPAA